MTKRGRPGLRSWLLSAALVGLAMIITLAVYVMPELRTPQQAAADAAPPAPSPITGKVEKRSLNGTIVLRAVVSAGATVDLKPSDALIAASPVVTALPTAEAASVKPGDVLIEANGEPIFAMNWPFPAYRDIHSGDSGPDVIQLQKTLAALKYSTSQSGIFDGFTRLGVSELYADRGYKAPVAPAGAITGGTVDSGGIGPSNLQQKGTAASQGDSGLVYLPARDVQAIPGPTSRVTSLPIHLGQKLSTPDLVLAKLDGKTSTVVAATTADRAGRITVGNTGTLTAGVPAQQFAVKVTGIASSVDDVAGLGKGIRIDLDFTDPAKTAAVSGNQTTSKLEITTGATNNVGLVLPITAIYSTQDGESYVIPASDPSARITVDPGVNVDGWVEIKGDSPLKEGDEVILGTERTP